MWLLVFMIMVMPYENNPYLYIADSFLGLQPDFTLIKLLGLVGFAWALARITTGAVPEGVLSSTQAKLFGAFFVGVIVAGLLSGTGFIAISRYLAFLMFLPFVLVAVRTHEDLRRVLYAFALSLILTFPYALRQMMRYDARMGVGLYEPNYFAANLVLVIPLTLAIAATQTTPNKRTLWLVGALVLVTSLFLTSSRGGFLGLLVAATVFVYRRRGAGAAMTLVAVLILAALPTTLGERALATLFEGAAAPAGLEASNEAHLALFWGALRMIGESPIAGVGPYNFRTLSIEYTGLDVGALAHNSYLEVGAELGLPVLVIFLFLIGSVLRAFRRSALAASGAQAHELAVWAEGLRSGLIGFLVAGIFISAQYQKMFWLVVFLAIAVERLAAAHQWAAAAEPAAVMESVAAPPVTFPRPI